jgi:hypothetical protein
MEPTSDNSHSPPRTKKRHRLGVLSYSSAVLLVWLSTLYFGGPTATWLLDDSWTQALGYAFKHNFQAGVDFIFTFGPLGYLYCYFSGYDSELFYVFVAWQLVMGLFVALILVALTRIIDGTRDKVIYLSLLIVVISSFPHDSIYFLAIIASVILAINPPSFIKKSMALHVTFVCVELFFLALICMTKFTHFVMASAGVFALTIVTWHTNSRKAAIPIPMIFAAFILLIWVACDQSLSNALEFIENSLRVARGYNDAMPLGFIIDELVLAFLSLFAMAIMLIGAIATPRKFKTAVTAALVLFGIYVAWKAGFVRQQAHATIYFAFAAIAPFIIGYGENLRSKFARRILALRYFAVSIALAGLFVAGDFVNYTPGNFVSLWSKRIVRNVSTLASLPEAKARLNERVSELKQQYDLPNIRARVGQSPVDIMSWGQGLIFLNEMAWRPRPVFQSYVAFTPDLISINGDFYAGDRAPEFVVFKLQAIDRQFPLMNDNEALKILLRDYQPLLVEKGYVLLMRNPRGRGRVSPGEILMEKEITFGEPIDVLTLRDKQLLLTLEIRKSFLGRLGTLLFKLIPTYIEIETVDGSSMSYRIVPGMTQTGFLINPLILTQEDFVGWYTGDGPIRPASFRVEARSRLMQRFFEPRISLKISEFKVSPYPVHDEFKQSVETNLHHPFSSTPE